MHQRAAQKLASNIDIAHLSCILVFSPKVKELKDTMGVSQNHNDESLFEKACYAPGNVESVYEL